MATPPAAPPSRERACRLLSPACCCRLLARSRSVRDAAAPAARALAQTGSCAASHHVYDLLLSVYNHKPEMLPHTTCHVGRLEEEQEFKEFAAQPGAMDRIFARIAPQVSALLFGMLG